MSWPDFIQVIPFAGTHISLAAEQSIRVAILLQHPVTLIFNEIEVLVRPVSTIQEVVEEWNKHA